MKNSKPFPRQVNRGAECCFVQFFSNNSHEPKQNDKNSNGFINPYKNKPFDDQKQIVFSTTNLKSQASGVKRSISGMKFKKRTTCRNSFETHNNQDIQKDETNVLKFVSPMRGSEIIQRCFSPKPQGNPSLATSQLQEKKKIESYFSQSPTINVCPANKIYSQHVERPQSFVKQEKSFGKIQFGKTQRLLNPEVAHQIPGNNIKVNFLPINKKSQNQTYQKVQNLQIPIKLKTQGCEPAYSQESFRKSKQMIKQNLNQSIKILKKSQQLEDIQQASREYVNESKKQVVLIDNIKDFNDQKQTKQTEKQTVKQNKQIHQTLEIPINPFKNIESMIVEVKREAHHDDEHEVHYERIKTKGRPTQSMMYMTKDLSRTKKIKQKRKTEAGLHDIQNMTVTSEFGQNDSSDQYERIDESAVMINFFNPSNQLRQRLQLSRSNWPGPSHEKNGFF